MTGRLAAIALLLGGSSVAAAGPPLLPLPDDSVYHLETTLTDSKGHAMAWADLRGKPRIVTMFYASCRYICPLVIDSLRSIERKLPPAEQERVGFVLVSMDPERDTPESLARLMAERRLDASHWQLLRPRPDDLRALAGMLGIRYRLLADGEFNHTTSLVLVDADGRVLARTDRLGADGDPAFLAAVRKAAAVSDSASGR
jgi:protein SCO1/2